MSGLSAGVPKSAHQVMQSGPGLWEPLRGGRVLQRLQPGLRLRAEVWLGHYLPLNDAGPRVNPSDHGQQADGTGRHVHGIVGRVRLGTSSPVHLLDVLARVERRRPWPRPRPKELDLSLVASSRGEPGNKLANAVVDLGRAV